jgi:hypothetical protein
MKRKKKAKPAYAPGESPTEVARAAQCSRPLAHRLLKRGLSKAEIVARMAQRHEIEEARSSAAIKTNGMTFSEAQTRKEIALSQLRELEVAERVRVLVPARQVQLFLERCHRTFVDELSRLPGELSDQLAVEDNVGVIHDLLDRRIKGALRHIADARELWESPLLPENNVA